MRCVSRGIPTEAVSDVRTCSKKCFRRKAGFVSSNNTSAVEEEVLDIGSSIYCFPCCCIESPSSVNLLLMRFAIWSEKMATIWIWWQPEISIFEEALMKEIAEEKIEKLPAREVFLLHLLLRFSPFRLSWFPSSWPKLCRYQSTEGNIGNCCEVLKKKTEKAFPESSMERNRLYFISRDIIIIICLKSNHLSSQKRVPTGMPLPVDRNKLFILHWKGVLTPKHSTAARWKRFFCSAPSSTRWLYPLLIILCSYDVVNL